MKGLKNLFRQIEFHFFLFFLGMGLFGRPFVRVLHSEQPQATFLRVFSVWAAAVVLLYFISTCCKAHESEENSKKDKDPRCSIRE